MGRLVTFCFANCPLSLSGKIGFQKLFFMIVSFSLSGTLQQIDTVGGKCTLRKAGYASDRCNLSEKFGLRKKSWVIYCCFHDYCFHCYFLASCYFLDFALLH